MNELKEKGVGQPVIQFHLNRRRRLSIAPIDAQQTVSQLIGSAAFVPAIDDAVGDPPEVFNQNKPERNRRRPEFADHERLYFW